MHWTGLTGRVCSKVSRPVLPTGLTGGTQKTPKILFQTVNLDQTTTKFDETWGITSPLPREHIPK